MENFDLLSTLVGILIKLAAGFIILGLFTIIIMEAISALFRLRNKFLRKFLLRIFNDERFVERLFNHPIIKIQGAQNSYLNAGYFSVAFLDLLSIKKIGDFNPELYESYPNNTFVEAFCKLSINASSMEDLQNNAKKLFYSVVQTISGYYKRTVQKLLFVVATFLVIGFNVNAIKLFNSITRNELINKVITALDKEKDLEGNVSPEKAKIVLSHLPADAYPLGWSKPDAPLTTAEIILTITGWVITIILTVFFAQMLFDVMNKFVNVRSKPANPDIVVSA
ncbi:hypothetical protein QTN47_05845 [Danxiaibacter flavus]|uniref:Uncharacterized protein n=1 Tax=Danxiaibacter flavus TaxID=3049108 RepID=A0ABV3ZBN3_9BACT|nr:hypothetical protein QNM32_05845 [Chitinophagaceae bacterium DXS]